MPEIILLVMWFLGYFLTKGTIDEQNFHDFASRAFSMYLLYRLWEVFIL